MRMAWTKSDVTSLQLSGLSRALTSAFGTGCHVSGRGHLAAFLLAMALGGAGVAAQTGTAIHGQSGELAAAPASGVVMDQVVAVVNGDLVLESDLDEERRMAAFQPFTDKTVAYSRQRAIDRLVDRTLILQQAKIQPEAPVTDAEVNTELATVRKEVPACKKEYDCASDAGWQRYIAAQGFTPGELMDRWRERMRVLRFIEQRFKMGIRITPAEIQAYYDKTLLPEYARQKAAPPRLATISDRIQEILLQQQVGALLEDWLSSLKAQGSVRMAKAGEVQP